MSNFLKNISSRKSIGTIFLLVALIFGALIIGGSPGAFAIPFFWILIFAVREIWITYFRKRRKGLATIYAALTVSLSLLVFSGWKENPVEKTSSAGIDDYNEFKNKEEADRFENEIIRIDFQSGVLAACSDLFSISPDEILYENNNKLYLEDCQNWGGTYEGDSQNPYDEGYFKTIEEMFSETPYWCWGNECVTESDF